MKRVFLPLLFLLFNFFTFSKGIVSLLPSITEIIVEYGKGKSLVAVSDYSVIPDEYKVERIGSLFNLNVEKLIRLNPDIVFAEVSYKERLSSIPALKGKVVYLSFLNLDDTFKNYKIIGKTLGVDKYVIDKKIGELTGSIKKLSSVNKCKGKKVLIILNSNSNRFYACGENYFSQVLEAIGFENALKTKVAYPDISLESFYKLNPDFIIVLSAEKPSLSLCQRNGLKKLLNCKNKTVFYIFGEKVLHAGSGLKELLGQLKEKMNLCFK